MRTSARLALVAFALFAIVLIVLFMTPSSYYTARQNNQTGVITPYPTAVTSIPKVLAYVIVAVLVIVAGLLIAKYAQKALP